MEIIQIKQHLDISTVLTHYNLKPNQHNMLLCPFHDDHSPSLKIYLQTNSFTCFGCGASGDVIEFIQVKEKCTKHEAITKASGFINPIYCAIPKQNKIPPTLVTQPDEFTRIAILTKYLQTKPGSFGAYDIPGSINRRASQTGNFASEP